MSKLKSLNVWKKFSELMRIISVVWILEMSSFKEWISLLNLFLISMIIIFKYTQILWFNWQIILIN